MRKLIMVLVLSMGTGCMSSQDKSLISTGAAVGQGNLKEWDTLDDAHKKAAHTNLVASYCVLDKDVNGTPLPTWVAALVAPAAPAPVVTPTATGK